MISFPVVGIGASAGGLEAVTELLAELSTPTSAAFLLVQHLDPEHSSLLSEILAKRTRLTVGQAQERTVPQPGHLYVIPPNATLTLADGALRLRSRETNQERHTPIDILFNSLAEECGHNAIVIVLSGTGSDGARGVQKIKEMGGITFAQDSDSARFFGMPKSAIDTGCVDFVLSPKEIARELGRISKHPYLNSEEAQSTELQSPEEHQLNAIVRLLLAKSGMDFTHYKRSTVMRRITRRMALEQVQGLAQYENLLRENSGERQALIADFLIGVTGFFRDSEAFVGLAETVFPALMQGRSQQDPLRLWVPGCATGEEVYSIAISLIEFLDKRADPTAIRIFGTDLSEAAIEKARRGEYVESIVREISSERLRRFFVKLDHHYQITKPIRDLCIFARQNVAHDPPFSHLDLISCRNVLIYLDQPLQQQVMRLFHYALKLDGFLMLGPSENIGQASDLFKTVDTHRKIYRRQAIASQLVAEREVDWNATPPGHGNRPIIGIPALLDKEKAQRETERLLLERYAPAFVLVEENLNVIYFHGETSRYLEHMAGPASLNLHQLARPGLLIHLSEAIRNARHEGAPVIREAAAVDMPNGVRHLRFEVIPLKTPQTDRLCYLILFEQPAARNDPSQRNRRLSKWLADLPWGTASPEKRKGRDAQLLQAELETTRSYLKTIVEENAAAKEELQSANEELATANEEFLSTNEELETAKEELESANEELATTNDELRTRNSELNELNKTLDQSRDYLDAIIETMRESLLVLEGNLRIKKANHAFYELFRTRPEETEGCFLYGLADGRWNIPALRKLLGEILPNDAILRDYEISQNFPEIGERTLVLNARRLRGNERREEMILLAIEDVTEHAAALYAIRDRRKDEFLAMLAHELRNPLAPIRNAVRLARMNNPNAATAKQYDIIERQLQDLVRLVDDLLDAARITRGDIVLKKEPVDLVDIVNQVLETTRQQVSEKNQHLELSLTTSAIGIHADPIRLKQIISNLLQNAVKYTEPGGRIELTIEHQANEAVIRVRDTGVGIDPETLPHVFELFFQVSTAFSRTRGGLGIGLTLVRRLVELHGGHIEVHSEGLGKGSEFVVRLPMLSASDGPVEMPEATTPEPAPLPSGSRRLLVVDDNTDVAETVAMLAESWGYKVEIANGGSEALEVAKNFRPNIALLDIGLPGMDGFELARRLRHQPETEKLFLIAVTGYGRDQDREEAKKAGFNHHLVKPVDPDRLKALLASLN